ncbi:MAG: hypothetical protein E5X94_00485 [Mesorhizobium sp.]|uniref:hypothetical protein n=1 Tax=Mesorhizobium sp. TaxID=1871066 RepID=UPI0011F44593|nr:hypothetical protein [Mesorhizobium sp.]TIN82732.1 MAG: hypothetical protein E5X97_28920 [Mesorhizobium sp.]TIN88316.1 MAG: hypothetical protein E5X94_00485 [Mesorhizobium sp.]TIO88593.1 MAG: hypothetical protein E5Y00_04760 [Mesorhizobium sp.]
MDEFLEKAERNHQERLAYIRSHAATKDRVIADLVDALKETLEIASRNEAGPFIRRALDALAKADALSP